MKPEKITMQGFGPYLDTTEIDFTLLSGNKLFLITGATGGGKTTILDAMCFALYGRATGGLRSWGQMRSIGAPDHTPTQVEYTFTRGSELYRFFRSQSVYAARKTGERKIKEEHACYKMQNGQWELILAGAESKVTQCAQDILGLDCEQFSKVIMLPQGEFRKLLLSTSSEKAKIFEKLFSTERWSKAADIITTQASALKRQVEDIFTARRTVLEREQVENVTHLEEKEARLQEQHAMSLSLAQKQQDAVAAAAKRLQTAEKLIELYERRTLQEKTAAQTREQKQKSDQQLITAQQKAEQIPALKQRHGYLLASLSKLETALESAKKAEDLKKRLSVLEQETIQIEKVIQQNEKAEQAAMENSKKGEAYVEDLQKETSKIPMLFTKYQTLKEISQSYDKLNELKALNQAQVRQVQQEESALQQSKLSLKALQNQLQDTKRLIEGNMAFELSLGLKEDAPCPVCGAMHHPAPACRQDASLSALQDDKERLELLIVAAEKTLEEVNTRFLQKQAQQKQTVDELTAAQSKCDGYNIYYKTIENDHAKAKRELQAAQALQEKLPRARQLLQQRKNEYETAHSTLESCKEKQTENKRLTDSCLSSLKTLMEYLPENENTVLELTARLQQQKQSAAQAEQEIVSLQAVLTDAQICSDVLKTQLESAQSALDRTAEEYSAFLQENKDIELNKAEEYKQKLEAITAEHRKTLEKTGELRQMSISVSSSLEQLKRTGAEAAEAEKQYNQALRLSKFLLGGNAGKTPVKMFVLGMMLDDIIIQANEYFSVLSSGRYSLNRMIENTGGNALKGLDIQIFDAYGGAMRSVYTLSGGELFLASLSLAFGLSDVVQSYSGGIRLDSIFIDEGFGTLDRETLDTALKALDNIKQMGRLVGIISHVTELKSRIGAKIEVLPSRTGSTVKIVTPD